MDLEQPYSSSSSASSKKPFPMIPFVPQEEECFPPHHTRTTSSNGGGAKAAAAAATAEAKSTPDPMAMMTASLSNIPMTDNDATTNTRDAGAAAASTIDNNNNKENRDPVQFINTTATKVSRVLTKKGDVGGRCIFVLRVVSNTGYENLIRWHIFCFLCVL